MRLRRASTARLFRAASICAALLSALSVSRVSAQGGGGASDEEPHILVIDVADPLRLAAQYQQKEFVERLRERVSPRVQIHFENIDVVRFPGAEMRRQSLEFLGHKYARTRLQAIVAVAPPALEFSVQLRKSLGHEMPIVAVAPEALIPEAAALRLRSQGISLVLVGDIENAVLRHALQLFPATRRVVLISDDVAWRFTAERSVAEISQGQVAGVLWSGLQIGEYRDSLATLGDTDLVLYRSVSRERDGTPWIPSEVLAAIRSASKRPVFGVADHLVTDGAGLIGGPTLSYATLGNVVADRTADLLLGGDARQLPEIVHEEWRWIYDWRELQKFNLTAKQLPPGAEFVNRPTPFWVNYPLQTTLAALALSLQLALILALTRRGQLLLRTRRDLRALAQRTTQALDDERARIARDLHDDLCQDLSLIAIEADQLGPPLGSHVAQGVQSAIRRAQQIARGLHPAYGPALGLSHALRALVHRFERVQGVPASIELRGDAEELDEEIVTALYRIAQEALANVAQHAKASRCVVRLHTGDEEVRLEVEDDGVGLGQRRAQAAGLGLLSMRERARSIGGVWSATPSVPKGTVVRVVAPRCLPEKRGMDD